MIEVLHLLWLLFNQRISYNARSENTPMIIHQQIIRPARQGRQSPPYNNLLSH